MLGRGVDALNIGEGRRAVTPLRDYANCMVALLVFIAMRCFLFFCSLSCVIICYYFCFTVFNIVIVALFYNRFVLSFYLLLTLSYVCFVLLIILSSFLQLAVSIFLMSEVLGKLWKRKMSTGERNMIDISFHVAELACALWFPCCLWNVTQ